MHRRLPAGPSSPSQGAGSGGFGLHCPLPRPPSKCHFHPFEKKPSWHQAALWNCQEEQLDFNSNLNPGVHPPVVKPTCLVQEETGLGDAHGPSPRRPHRSLSVTSTSGHRPQGLRDRRGGSASSKHPPKQTSLVVRAVTSGGRV